MVGRCQALFSDSGKLRKTKGVEECTRFWLLETGSFVTLLVTRTESLASHLASLCKVLPHNELRRGDASDVDTVGSPVPSAALKMTSGLV